MTEVIIERKFTLKTLAKGDYLLIGNDGKTLWRIRTYEDGPSHGVESMTRDREFWGVWRWDSPVTLGKSAIEIDNDSRWNAWDLSMYKKREDAIQAALRSELPKPKQMLREDPRPVGQILLDAVAAKGVE